MRKLVVAGCENAAGGDEAQTAVLDLRSPAIQPDEPVPIDMRNAIVSH